MSISELNQKLAAMIPARPARELTCDECGGSDDVEVISDPRGPCRDTGHLSEKILCEHCR